MVEQKVLIYNKEQYGRRNMVRLSGINMKKREASVYQDIDRLYLCIEVLEVDPNGDLLQRQRW